MRLEVSICTNPGFSAGCALLIATALILLSPACASQARGPQGALGAYGQALRSGNYAAAYEMMSSDFRDRYSKEDFIRMMKENPQEVSETAARLQEASREIEVTAELHYGRGDRMRLVREGSRWRIASNPIQFYSQATPRDAVRSFVRAYRLKRWDILLRFVPNKYRERMTAENLRQQFEGDSRDEVDIMMKILGANVDEPIEDKGNEARMPYGDRYEVQFVREDGLWKIRDID
ncbi:MAG: hypothetical protein MJE77_31495 [Proteobacteria bacterium]|nr:hypothetical protein [Pseudomonadota bacterium]